MDTLDYYNQISEQSYKSLLSDSLLESYKSQTFTFNNIIRILSISSKKQVLGAVKGNPNTSSPNDSTFVKFIKNVNAFTRDIETFGKTLFNNLLLDLEDDMKTPSTVKGTIEDFIRERNEIMQNKLPPHRRSTDLIRQQNSIVEVISGLSEIKDNEYQSNYHNQELKERSKEIQTLQHVNGKIKYKGHIVNNEYHGLGILNHYNGNLLYRGNFVNGEPDGDDCEIFHFNSALKYKGPIKNGNYNGEGALYHDNGCLKYKGNFVNDKPCAGEACIYHSNGNLEYSGMIQNGLFEGYGSLYHKNGNQEYEGNFFKGGPHTNREGESVIYYDNGRVKFKGVCKNGYFNGFGIQYNKRGLIEYRGEFKMGEPCDVNVAKELRERGLEDDEDDTYYKIDNKKKDFGGNDMQDLSQSEISLDKNERHEIPLNIETEKGFYNHIMPVVYPGPPINKIEGIKADVSKKATFSLNKANTKSKSDNVSPFRSNLKTAKDGGAISQSQITQVPKSNYQTNDQKSQSKGLKSIPGPSAKSLGRKDTATSKNLKASQTLERKPTMEKKSPLPKKASNANTKAIPEGSSKQNNALMNLIPDMDEQTKKDLLAQINMEKSRDQSPMLQKGKKKEDPKNPTTSIARKPTTTSKPSVKNTPNNNSKKAPAKSNTLVKSKTQKKATKKKTLQMSPTGSVKCGEVEVLPDGDVDYHPNEAKDELKLETELVVEIPQKSNNTTSRQASPTKSYVKVSETIQKSPTKSPEKSPLKSPRKSPTKQKMKQQIESENESPERSEGVSRVENNDPDSVYSKMKMLTTFLSKPKKRQATIDDWAY